MLLSGLMLKIAIFAFITFMYKFHLRFYGHFILKIANLDTITLLDTPVSYTLQIN